jgi:3-deoxy-7-phosphoheptulonate synthase
MSLAAIAAGADGLIIEVHPNPEKALSDGDQSLTLSEFALLMESVRQLASVLPGRVKEEVLCSSASVA